jgi:capsular polysaccharide transport system permease protein
MTEASFRLGALEDDIFARAKRAAGLLRRFWHPSAAAALPVLAAAIYYLLIAAPLYISESKFIVRMAAPPAPAAFNSFLQSNGITRSQDDAFSVDDYLQSRDAVRGLETEMQLRAIYARPESDWLARFPRFWESNSFESLFRYAGNRIAIVHNATTGITTLRTMAFRPQDSFRLNATLLEFGKAFLNKLNDRARADAVTFSQREVDDAERRVLDAQAALTEFRNKELMIDPKQTSTIALELIGQLAAELASVRARRTELMNSAPASAEIPDLSSRIDALEQQIESERAKVVGSDSSVAPRIATYERLMLTREFAEKALTSASNALDAARGDIRHQQLYLDLVVEPNQPDEAEEPQGLKNLVVIAVLCGGGYLLGRLLVTAARDYLSG